MGPDRELTVKPDGPRHKAVETSAVALSSPTLFCVRLAIR